MDHPVKPFPQAGPTPSSWWGPLMALAALGPWGSGLPGLANAMREPLSPGASSLAPLEIETFRQRYGQEALFRLKLGVEAGERSTPGKETPAPNCGRGWSGSAQEQQFEAALKREQWYGAGEVLGLWRRQCGGGDLSWPHS